MTQKFWAPFSEMLIKFQSCSSRWIFSKFVFQTYIQNVFKESPIEIILGEISSMNALAGTQELHSGSLGSGKNKTKQKTKTKNKLSHE